MAKLRRIWVIHTTSRVEDANTGDDFDLELPLKGKAADSAMGKRIPFRDLPHDERERGRIASAAVHGARLPPDPFSTLCSLG